MESGTLLGFAVAGTAGLLVAAGSALARGRRPVEGRRRVIGMTLLAALIAAACGLVVVAVGTDVVLHATTAICPLTGSESTAVACVPSEDVGKQAFATGLLGAIGAGVLVGCGTAWRMSHSLRLVVGGLVATLGAAVLLVESLVVLVLWAA